MEHVAGDGASRRVAVITGVSRPSGIAAAVARRLGASHDLWLTGLSAYDREQRSESGDQGAAQIRDEVRALGARVEHRSADLSQPLAPAEVVAGALSAFGRVDALVAAHAHSVVAPLDALDAAGIDSHLIVNVRATLLLVKEFARVHDPAWGAGRIVLFSSGQRLGPMPDELAYAASKGGVEALVLSLADGLAGAGITVNAVNPGPTDTGWLRGEAYERVRAKFPNQQWGTPDDAARAVAWLAGEDAAWITGQVLDSEGGFRR